LAEYAVLPKRIGTGPLNLPMVTASEAEAVERDLLVV
jgi:hypothetical protein